MLVFAKSVQKIGIPRCNLSIDLETHVVPSTNPITIVKVRRAGVARVDERLVIAASRTDRPRPTSMAIISGADVVGIQELLARFMIDAILDVPHFADRRVYEAMA